MNKQQSQNHDTLHCDHDQSQDQQKDKSAFQEPVRVQGTPDRVEHSHSKKRSKSPMSSRKHYTPLIVHGQQSGFHPSQQAKGNPHDGQVPPGQGFPQTTADGAAFSQPAQSQPNNYAYLNQQEGWPSPACTALGNHLQSLRRVQDSGVNGNMESPMVLANKQLLQAQRMQQVMEGGHTKHAINQIICQTPPQRKRDKPVMLQDNQEEQPSSHAEQAENATYQQNCTDNNPDSNCMIKGQNQKDKYNATAKQSNLGAFNDFATATATLERESATRQPYWMGSTQARTKECGYEGCLDCQEDKSSQYMGQYVGQPYFGPYYNSVMTAQQAYGMHPQMQLANIGFHHGASFTKQAYSGQQEYAQKNASNSMTPKTAQQSNKKPRQSQSNPMSSQHQTEQQTSAHYSNAINSAQFGHAMIPIIHHYGTASQMHGAQPYPDPKQSQKQHIPPGHSIHPQFMYYAPYFHPHQLMQMGIDPRSAQYFTEDGLPYYPHYAIHVGHPSAPGYAVPMSSNYDMSPSQGHPSQYQYQAYHNGYLQVPQAQETARRLSWQQHSHSSHKARSALRDDHYTSLINKKTGQPQPVEEQAQQQIDQRYVKPQNKHSQVTLGKENPEEESDDDEQQLNPKQLDFSEKAMSQHKEQQNALGRTEETSRLNQEVNKVKGLPIAQDGSTPHIQISRVVDSPPVERISKVTRPACTERNFKEECLTERSRLQKDDFCAKTQRSARVKHEHEPLVDPQQREEHFEMNEEVRNVERQFTPDRNYEIYLANQPDLKPHELYQQIQKDHQNKAMEPIQFPDIMNVNKDITNCNQSKKAPCFIDIKVTTPKRNVQVQPVKTFCNEAENFKQSGKQVQFKSANQQHQNKTQLVEASGQRILNVDSNGRLRQIKTAKQFDQPISNQIITEQTPQKLILNQLDSELTGKELQSNEAYGQVNDSVRDFKTIEKSKNQGNSKVSKTANTVKQGTNPSNAYSPIGGATDNFANACESAVNKKQNPEFTDFQASANETNQDVNSKRRGYMFNPESQMYERVIRKRMRKTPSQLRTLNYEFDRDPHWTKEILLMIAQRTKLSEAQVYKWGWDQKRKKFGIEEAEKMRQFENELDQKNAQRAKQQSMQKISEQINRITLTSTTVGLTNLAASRPLQDEDLNNQNTASFKSQFNDDQHVMIQQQQTSQFDGNQIFNTHKDLNSFAQVMRDNPEREQMPPQAHLSSDLIQVPEQQASDMTLVFDLKKSDVDQLNNSGFGQSQSNEKLPADSENVKHANIDQKRALILQNSSKTATTLGNTMRSSYYRNIVTTPDNKPIGGSAVFANLSKDGKVQTNPNFKSNDFVKSQKSDASLSVRSHRSRQGSRLGQTTDQSGISGGPKARRLEKNQTKEQARARKMESKAAKSSLTLKTTSSTGQGKQRSVTRQGSGLVRGEEQRETRNNRQGRQKRVRDQVNDKSLVSQIQTLNNDLTKTESLSASQKDCFANSDSKMSDPSILATTNHLCINGRTVTDGDTSNNNKEQKLHDDEQSQRLQDLQVKTRAASKHRVGDPSQTL